MKEPLVLTYDIGTQSTRAMLINQHGKILDFKQIKYTTPYIVKEEGFAEQTPNFYYDMMCKVSNELKESCGQYFEDIIAVTITTIRNNVVLLDKDKNALRDIIIWIDNRRSNSPLPMPKPVKSLLGMVGLEETLTSIYQDFKSVWFKEHEPEIWAKTDKYVMLSTYLNYLLTGELKDTPANMIAPLPFSMKNRDWDHKFGMQSKLIGIPLEMMCELTETGSEIGNITKKASEDLGIPCGLPLIASGSDKGCETLGLSVIKDNQAAISFGTIGTIQFASKKYFDVMAFTPSYPAVVPGRYNPETNIYRGFWMVSWFIKNFCTEEQKIAKELGCMTEDVLNSKLKDIPIGCNGLLLQPYWGGCFYDSSAKGSIVGFTDVHTKYHLYRAIIEGIGMTLRTGLYNMQKKSGQQITEIFVGGGGSQSPEICQIVADIFNLPVKRTQTHEACGVGSSMVAFIARGIYKDYDDAIKNMVEIKDIFEPIPENHAQYEKIYTELYGKIQPKLKPIYKKMKTGNYNF